VQAGEEEIMSGNSIDINDLIEAAERIAFEFVADEALPPAPDICGEYCDLSSMGQLQVALGFWVEPCVGGERLTEWG